MATKYVWIPFQFDMGAFGADMRRAIDSHGSVFIAALLEIDHSTLENWANGVYDNRRFPHPSMTNFLKACNTLNLDPRDYFRLAR